MLFSKLMSTLNYKTFTVNFIEENCYLLWDESREAVIVDCGAFLPAECEQIRAFVAENDLTVKHLLNTHAHFDHLFGAQFCSDTWGVLPEISADEVETYHQAVQQMQAFLHRAFPLQLPPLGKTFSEGETIRFGTHELRVIATPGHTPGGVCFYCEAEGLLLTGDSLFRCSIGRCDLPGGDACSLVTALSEKILTLPEDVKVLPGHGPSTTIGYERMNNMMLR